MGSSGIRCSLGDGFGIHFENSLRAEVKGHTN
jgi:hypothetical protein